MKDPRIVSMIKINGEWINQDDVPPDILNEAVEQAISRAAAAIGFETKRIPKEKTV